MTALWLALALAAPGSESPAGAAPSPDTVGDSPSSADDDPDPARVLQVLDEDVAFWGEAVASRSAVIARGELPAQVLEAHELALKVLFVRLDLAQVRLEVAPREPTPAERAQVATLVERARALGQVAVEIRLTHELDRINDSLVRGNTESAARDARWTLGFLEEWRVRVPEPGRLDAAWLALAQVIAREDRAAGLAAAWGCARECATDEARASAEGVARQLGRPVSTSLDAVGDTAPAVASKPAAPAVPRKEAAEPPPEPERGRWRAGLGLVLPLGAGTFEGAPVQRGLSGALDLAAAPTSAGCVTVRLGADRWRSDGLSTPLDLRRVRGEIGWCPQLAALRIGAATFAVRPVVGVGLARSVAVRVDEREVLWGLGPHGRVEVPIKVGPVEIIPEIGLSPYGRAAAVRIGASRAPYRMLDRASVGIGLSLSL